MLFKAFKNARQKVMLDKLEARCVELGVIRFSLILGCPWFEESYLPSRFNLIRDDLGYVVGINPKPINDRDYTDITHSVVTFNNEHEISHQTHKGWVISKI
ncbi:hypothetical protein V9649_004232 [Vibrio parahaemolyticus]|nr:hypothetical protein [Vibrio parahaemolyticus]